MCEQASVVLSCRYSAHTKLTFFIFTANQGFSSVAEIICGALLTLKLRACMYQLNGALKRQ